MRAWLANHFLKLIGWQVIGQPPDPPKSVIIAAPHTSNWDFMYLYLVASMMGVRIYWMGKEELFKGILGPISRTLGGIPVKRNHSANMVQQMAQAFSEKDEMLLAVPPAATRRKTDFWKSGFYYIALEAGVPITLGFVDYGKKQAGLGPSFIPSGDLKTDMDFIRAFYADIQGKFPQNKSVIRLKQEDEQSVNSAAGGDKH